MVHGVGGAWISTYRVKQRYRGTNAHTVWDTGILLWVSFSHGVNTRYQLAYSRVLGASSLVLS